MGILQYVQDYDEELPHQQFYNMPANQFYAWQTAIIPYTKSVNIYLCPSNTFNSIDLSTGYPISYAPNGGLMPDWNKNYTVALPEIQNVSTTVLVSESRAAYAAISLYGILFDSPLNEYNQGAYVAGTPTPSASLGLAMEHMGTVNLLYMDGHARAQKLVNTGIPADQWWTAQSCLLDSTPWWCSPGHPTQSDVTYAVQNNLNPEYQ